MYVYVYICDEYIYIYIFANLLIASCVHTVLHTEYVRYSGPISTFGFLPYICPRFAYIFSDVQTFATFFSTFAYILTYVQILS